MRSTRILSSRASFLTGLLLLVLFCTSSLFGQNATGTISGTVADSSGAVIPKATVVLTDEATKSKRETVSNGSGFFSFVAILPSTYTLTVSAAGFKNWEEQTITITQGK